MATVVVPAEREPVFAGQHRGFAALFALATIHIMVGAIYGQKPVAHYFLPNSAGELIIWAMPTILWLNYRCYEGFRAGRNLFSHIRQTAAEDRAWFIRGFLVIAFAVPANRAFTAIKVAIPSINPFWADPYLIEADKLLFFGTDPWRVTHALIGPALTHAIDWLYSMWFAMLAIIFLWAAFSRDPAFQLRASFSHLCVWTLIGSLAAVGLSSVGPCFLHPVLGSDYFLPLMDKLQAQGPLWSLHWQSFLLEARQTESLGKGISAMPSVHVAIAYLLYLMCRSRFGSRAWQSVAAMAYCVIIWVGSVHLGWHYALDGLVSVLLTSLIWKTSRLITA